MKRMFVTEEAFEGDKWSKESGFIDGKWVGFDLTVHTNDGYKLLPVPNQIIGALGSLGGTPSKIVKSISFIDGIWTVKIEKPSGSYLEIKNKDLTDMTSRGLTGVRVDRDGTTLLYFKG